MTKLHWLLQTNHHLGSVGIVARRRLMAQEAGHARVGWWAWNRSWNDECAVPSMLDLLPHTLEKRVGEFLRDHTHQPRREARDCSNHRDVGRPVQHRRSV